MPVALADGALGIEARHMWNGLVLNDLSVYPQYKIRDIVGLFDFPDIEDNFENKTEALGAEPLPSYARVKNVTYTIEVRGQTLQQMRNAGAALRAAFGPDISTGLNPTRRMLIIPHPVYEPSIPQHTFQGRCLQLSQGTDAQERGENAIWTYARPVVIGIRLYDPRIYEWDGANATNPKW